MRPLLERVRHPLDLIGREASAVEPHEEERADVFLLERDGRLSEGAVVERERLALPAAQAREIVHLVLLAPLRGNPVAVAEQAEFAVDSLVMREPHEDARQDPFPALL